MKPKKTDPQSSRSILDRIGINSDNEFSLLDEEEDLFESPDQSLARALTARYEALMERYPFKPGDLVTWKPGMSNRRYPKPGKPAVVVAVLEAPVFDQERDSGSPYFREPLDIVLGVYAEEAGKTSDFLTWHFDSRRLQLWSEGGER